MDVSMRLLHVGCLAAFLLAPAALLAQVDPQPQAELVREEIVGIALFPDGETPVAKLPVRVWDADQRKTVFRTETDADGIFRIPPLPAGRRYIFVGRARIDVRIVEEQQGSVYQHHDIVVVLTRPMLFARYPGIEEVLLIGEGALLDLLVTSTFVTPPEPPRIVSP